MEAAEEISWIWNTVVAKGADLALSSLSRFHCEFFKVDYITTLDCIHEICEFLEFVTLPDI